METLQAYLNYPPIIAIMKSRGITPTTINNIDNLLNITINAKNFEDFWDKFQHQILSSATLGGQFSIEASVESGMGKWPNELGTVMAIDIKELGNLIKSQFKQV